MNINDYIFNVKLKLKGLRKWTPSAQADGVHLTVNQILYFGEHLFGFAADESLI
jgi:hypothetical protein